VWMQARRLWCYDLIQGCLDVVTPAAFHLDTSRGGVQVAIKKVLQDKRFKNRELQIMKMMHHPNVVGLKHCFYSTTEKDEVGSSPHQKPVA
jgi:hypothetical protein